MFIDLAMNQMTRAPTERNASGNEGEESATFRSSRARQMFWTSKFYKHYVPTGRSRVQYDPLHS